MFHQFGTTEFEPVPDNRYGYAIRLPEYTFEPTPLGQSLTTGKYGGPISAAAALVGTSAFSAVADGLCPAPGPLHYFSPSRPNTTALNQPYLPHSTPKMDANGDVYMDDSYIPDCTGALVGTKVTSTAITQEYAKAHEVYVQKTLALPQTYSHYRPIQGDGNCGWRAIGFGYFETLVMLGDKARIEKERTRISSLGDYIDQVGGVTSMVYQDMADATDELFERILETIGDQKLAMVELMRAFNDSSISNSVMYHFRLLASSWLKENEASYSAFVASGEGIAGHCQAVLERHGVEIEHLGIMSVANILLKPAGFVLEIAYLDRSPGPRVNTYRFPEEANGQDVAALGPIIYLLFRPDHYDLLYPASGLLVNPAAVDADTQFVSNPVTLQGLADGSLDPLSFVPCFGASTPDLVPDLVPSDGSSPIAAYAPTSPESSWMPSPYADPMQHAAQAAALTLPIHPPPPPPPPPAPAPFVYSLRFSGYCSLPQFVENPTWRDAVTCMTNSFKNSHFNVAHYANPNFQPEEYKPDPDEWDAVRNRRKRGSL
ncbi:ubiquitin thioesterase OTUB1 [Diplogelasinospora grovesii]|uniref:ubiquitinyl hydrolase 1 n=1 Tax=Diplogelasinospora grovesii TaxID=303347 RepID=A0AAN6NE04_9PEZI|nr:ubiquitin thioesterase OTUB1 [Diplogelasinospora grovesii]